MRIKINDLKSIYNTLDESYNMIFEYIEVEMLGNTDVEKRNELLGKIVEMQNVIKLSLNR